MITSLFKNTILSYLFIVLVSIALWGFAFFNEDPNSLVTLSFAGESYHLSKQIAIIISFFATLISGFFLNNRINKYLFSYGPNNLFLFFYLCFFSIELSNSSFLVYIGVSFLLIIFVHYLLSFVTNKNSVNQVFNSAFIIGVLCFQNTFFILFLLLLIQNLSTTKRVGVSEIALILTGFIIPIFLVFSLSILTDNLHIIGTLWDFDFSLPQVSWRYGIFLAVATFFSVLGYQCSLNKRSGTDIGTWLLVKNLFVYLLVSLAIGAGSIFLFPQYYVVFLITLPLSIFISFFLLESTSKWKELAFVMIIALTFLMR